MIAALAVAILAGASRNGRFRWAKPRLAACFARTAYLHHRFSLDHDDPLVQDLLGLRDAVTGALRLPPTRSPIRVVIFERREQYTAFFSRNYPDLPHRRAFFIQQRDNLAVFTCRGELLRDDLRHELTHALLHASLPSVPLWLDEGIANYFEVGPQRAGANPRHAAALQKNAAQGAQLDLRRLEELRDLEQMSVADYREAWLWVHFCLRDAAGRNALLEHLAALRSDPNDRLLPRLTAIALNPPMACARHLAGLEADPTAVADDAQYPRHSTPLAQIGRWMERLR